MFALLGSDYAFCPFRFGTLAWDLNPIELSWSKLKAVLRQIGASTVTTLWAAIEDARNAITRGDAAGWFKHCGYAHQVK